MNKKYVTHLSLEDRKNIELGIVEGLSKTQIAKKINRNISTVSKEILKHRKLKPRNIFNTDSICIHLKDCHRCIKKCERYQEHLVLEEMTISELVIVALILVNVDQINTSITQRKPMNNTYILLWILVLVLIWTISLVYF